MYLYFPSLSIKLSSIFLSLFFFVPHFFFQITFKFIFTNHSYPLPKIKNTKKNVTQEPENIDKEFLRKWYTSNCDPYNDQVLPAAPTELVNELSRRLARYILYYIHLFIYI